MVKDTHMAKITDSLAKSVQDYYGTVVDLGCTRYAPHVRVEGDTSTHHGPFGRATVPAPEAPAASSCC